MPARPASQARAALKEQLLAALRPIASYWLFLAIMFAAFSLAVMIEEPSTGSIGALFLLAVSTVGGVATGQVLALLRLRDWLIYLFAILWWTIGTFYTAALSIAAGPLGPAVGVVVFLFPFFLTGGLWSLRTGRALFAAWVPLIYASGTAVLMAEAQGKVSTWESGQKWEVWNLFTFGVLVLGIVLLLGFLLAREGHRLVLWRRSPVAVLAAGVAQSGAARPRLSFFGWVLIGLLAFGLAIGTAFIAPYLWRTGPSENGDQNAQGDPQQDGQPQSPKDSPPHSGRNAHSGRPSRDRRGPGENGKMVDVREDARPDPEGGGGVVIDPLVLLFLATVGVVLGGPPVRRLLIVERLRRPASTVSATARVSGSWRLVELALSDAGVEIRQGEPALGLVHRADPVLRLALPLEVDGLVEAAEIRDRVAYGLGVNPADVAQMEEVANRAFDTLWERLGDMAQIRALYRLV